MKRAAAVAGQSCVWGVGAHETRGLWACAGENLGMRPYLKTLARLSIESAQKMPAPHAQVKRRS